VFVGCSLLLAGWLAGWLLSTLPDIDRAQASGIAPVNRGSRLNPQCRCRHLFFSCHGMACLYCSLCGESQINSLEILSTVLLLQYRSVCAYKDQLMQTNNRLPACTCVNTTRGISLPMAGVYSHSTIHYFYSTCKRSVFLVVCTAPATPTLACTTTARSHRPHSSVPEVSRTYSTENGDVVTRSVAC